MKSLSGLNPRQDAIKRLDEDLKRITAEFASATSLLERGMKLDENLFAALRAALATAGTMNKSGVEYIKNSVKKLGRDVRELYLDKKAQGELLTLLKGLKKALGDFEALEKDAPTIIKRDAEVAKEMEYFSQVFSHMIHTLGARLALSKGMTESEEIRDLMIEEGIMDPSGRIINEAFSYGELEPVLRSHEFEEAQKAMKFISTHGQLKKGTLVFDTGISGANWAGEEEPHTSYVLKIYSDGQVRAEVRGHLSDGPFHYKLGDRIKGDNPTDMYKKALINVVERYNNKKARHKAELNIAQKAAAEWQEKQAKILIDKDAEIEDKDPA
jgi:hypothetical protein